MGKCWRCCFPKPNNTNSTPQSHQSTDIPESSSAASIKSIRKQSNSTSQSHQSTDIPESSSAASIKSIQNNIREENTTKNIDELIKKLNEVISKTKGKGEEVSTSSAVEYLASTTRSASEVVDFVSTEAQKISNLGIISHDLGSVATSLLKTIGDAHFTFLGLSLVAFTLERYLKKKSNDSSCMGLLEELIELAKEVKKFKEAIPGESEKARKVILEIVVGAVICCDYIAKGPASRYWAAVGMESQLQERQDKIQYLRDSLTLTATTYIADCVGGMERQIATRSVPRSSELLDFQPEGIEEQVANVKELLDIEGNEQALAVVIVGIGGIGKTTLAASVIKSLNISSTEFMFSMVTIDQKTRDLRSHITQLQSDIIFHFTGDALYLQDTQQGRQKLQAAMAGKSCFLYIDNVADSYFIKELLPRDLLSQKSSEGKSESEKSVENSQNQKQKTKIRILITSRQNQPLFNIKNFIHEFQNLSDDTAEKFLIRTILHGNERAHDFDEERKINELAKACGGIPLLLSTFGNHLKDNRDKGSYEEAIKALTEGTIDRYSDGLEELLSEKLMFVYDQMKDEEAQEAFIDICTYFHGWSWNEVAYIVDNAILNTLYNKKLVNKSEKSTVTVHDILRLMGAKKANGTRLMNYQEFLNVNDDESKLKSVKGMELLNDTFLATLETRHLNAMRDSLRVLVLGDWVRVDGPPCHRTFKKLRYLQVGDLKDFPFKDISEMEKLGIFWNGSKPGMELAQLPPRLKKLTHEIPNRDRHDFARLPLKNLKSLKVFSVRTKGSARLPQGFKLPASLEHLWLNSCEQLPETLGHFSALHTLSLDRCDLKCFPQGFTQSVGLRHLSVQHCTNMISLPDNNFGSLCSLINLQLKGCTGLLKLPADLGKLTALQNLDIGECEKLSALPANFGGLTSLKTLDLNGCINLERLPDSFGMLSIEHLTLQSLLSLKEIPQSIGDLSRLKSLKLISCHSLEFVPDSFVQLKNLRTLVVEDCINLGALPKNFDQLRSLEMINLSRCPHLKSLPDGFDALKTLKSMQLTGCSSLVNLPACFDLLSCLEELYLWWCPVLEGTTLDKIVKLHNCHYVNITESTKLIKRWHELKEEIKKLPMIVLNEHARKEFEEEMDRVRRVGLLCGKCVELDSTTAELNHHSSLSVPNNTTITLISLHLDQRQLFQATVDMAKERATNNCAGQLRIIYVCKRSGDSDAPKEEEETEKIRQALMMLPQGISYVIPSTDSRRLSLIGRAFFDNANVFNEGTGPKLLCFMVDVREDDQGHQIFKDGKPVTEDEVSEKSGEKLISLSENSDEEIESSDGIVEFINCICESKTQSPSENMVGDLIQKLKNNNIDHFSDNNVKVDHLQGKTVAIILIDQNYPRMHKITTNLS